MFCFFYMQRCKDILQIPARYIWSLYPDLAHDTSEISAREQNDFSGICIDPLPHAAQSGAEILQTGHRGAARRGPVARRYVSMGHSLAESGQGRPSHAASYVCYTKTYHLTWHPCSVTHSAKIPGALLPNGEPA